MHTILAQKYLFEMIYAISDIKNVYFLEFYIPC